MLSVAMLWLSKVANLALQPTIKLQESTITYLAHTGIISVTYVFYMFLSQHKVIDNIENKNYERKILCKIAPV